MGLINEYLKKIKEAVYGEEVRDSIHDAIEQCYKDAVSYTHLDVYKRQEVYGST